MALVSQWLDVEFEQYQDIFQPNKVAEFLATQNWSCLADRSFGQLWAHPDQKTAEISSIVLPKMGSEDFDRRISESLKALTSILGMGASELAEAVSSVHADLFFVRIDQSMTDGTIPLRQARRLLEGIDQMIKSAAIATANPHHSGRGKAPAAVNSFMTEDVRMGHTKRGSFIITVAARHDDEAPDSSGAQPTPASNDLPPDTFTRRVMTTLSKSLSATSRHIGNGNDFVDLDDALVAGVRLPLIEALSEIGASEGLKSLDLSFEWSASQPTPNDPVSEVHFVSTDFAKLMKLEERLRRVHTPEEETIVGPVIELRRSETPDPDHDSGDVVIRADVEGRLRKVRVELSGDDYNKAIAAHQARTPFIVTGTLGKQGRSWSLTGKIGVGSINELALPGVASEPVEPELFEPRLEDL